MKQTYEGQTKCIMGNLEVVNSRLTGSLTSLFFGIQCLCFSHLYSVETLKFSFYLLQGGDGERGRVGEAGEQGVLVN